MLLFYIHLKRADVVCFSNKIKVKIKKKGTQFLEKQNAVNIVLFNVTW